MSLGKKLLLLSSFLLLTSWVHALPKDSRVPGGVAVMSLTDTSAAMPSVTFQGQPVAVIEDSGQWKALLGLSLSLKAGEQSFDVDGERVAFWVQAKKYRTQRLTIRDKNRVNPDKKSLQRIKREAREKKRLRHIWSEMEPDLAFIKPVKGRDTGRFGLKRILNGQPRSPHSGMDIAAGTGTPIKAASSGEVIHTDNFFFSGQVVYIDHGRGLISMYAHLSKILVQKGDYVEKGTTLGLVGKTGRATGPHLHWSVYLNGATVNPALFIKK